MKQSPSWEAQSHSAILNHIIPVHTLPPYSVKIHFYFILPSTPLYSEWSLPFKISNPNFVQIITPMCATWLPHSWFDHPFQYYICFSILLAFWYFSAYMFIHKLTWKRLLFLCQITSRCTAFHRTISVHYSVNQRNNGSWQDIPQSFPSLMLQLVLTTPA